MSVLIGHASIDENGKAAHGKGGDQTKKEVCTRNWYKKSWDVVLRPKTAEMAEKMAKACEAACANEHIGYDQGQRNTLHTEALKVGYDLSKISNNCECDCSSLMCVCAIAGGAPIDKLYYYNNMGTTRTIRGYFRDTGMFQILTDTKYLATSDYLKRGDVIVNEGSHTVMVLTNGPKAGGNIAPIAPINADVIGIATARGSINIRTGPSTGYKAIGFVRKNEQVQVLEITSNNWYKIVWAGTDSGYAYVSNSGGKYFDYTSISKKESKPVEKFAPYKVKIITSTLRIRKGPGTKYGDAGYIRKNGVFGIMEEIVDEKGKVWGLLDEFALTRDGWISLSYTQKI